MTDRRKHIRAVPASLAKPTLPEKPLSEATLSVEQKSLLNAIESATGEEASFLNTYLKMFQPQM